MTPSIIRFQLAGSTPSCKRSTCYGNYRHLNKYSIFLKYKGLFKSKTPPILHSHLLIPHLPLPQFYTLSLSP